MGKARYPDIDVEPYKELPSQSVKQVDTSPKVLNEEGNWLTNTALNDHIVDEDSYMAHKMAYNNSITGLAYKFHKGVDKYPEVQRALETGEYDPGVLEEAYSMLFGFTFPLDIATFAASAGAGKLAQLGAVSMLKNGLIKKGITTDIGVSVASSMANMGTFIGAQNISLIWKKVTSEGEEDLANATVSVSLVIIRSQNGHFSPLPIANIPVISIIHLLPLVENTRLSYRNYCRLDLFQAVERKI